MHTRSQILFAISDSVTARRTLAREVLADRWLPALEDFLPGALLWRGRCGPVVDRALDRLGDIYEEMQSFVGY